MKNACYILLLVLLSISCNAQNSDIRSLTRDVRSLMYSDPEKALKTADYLLSSQHSISAEEIYDVQLLEAEIHLNLRNYNAALLKLISANKTSQEVNNTVLRSKNEFILAQIYLKLGFNDNYELSIDKLKKYSNSLSGIQKLVASNYIKELNILEMYQKNKLKPFYEEIKKVKIIRNPLDQTSNLRLKILKSSVDQSPLSINDSLGYFNFLHSLQKVEFYINQGSFEYNMIDDLHKKFPQYNGGLLYLNVYKNWSAKECAEKTATCFESRNKYLGLLKLSLSDRLEARVNIINLHSQIETFDKMEQKQMQVRILLLLAVFFAIGIVGCSVYYFIVLNKSNIASIILEKENLSRDYEKKLTGHLNNKTNTTFVIPEKTENIILANLKMFESSEEMRNPNLSLALLAKQLNTNSKYLSEIINKQKEMSFSNYLNELRINYIVDKMRNNPEYLSYKTSYLAEEAGFLSRTTFTTIFKKITGQSPSQFIEQLKSNQ